MGKFKPNKRKTALPRKRRRTHPIMYRHLPQSMKVALNYRTYETATSSSSPFYNTYGLVQYLGKLSSYSDSLYGLYKYSVIHACQITAKLTNVGSEPIVLAIAVLPYSWQSGSPSLGELLDKPGCVKSTSGTSTGRDTAKVSKYMTAAQALGKDYQVARYQQNSSQAASPTLFDNDEPVFTVMASAFNGTTAISFRIEVEVTYHAEFYNLDSS